MVRALKRVENSSTDENAELDDIYSFFQNAWHLKDWLDKDKSILQVTRDAVVHDAENSDTLKFCADLANGSKHLKLARSVRKGATLLRAGLSVTDSATGKVISEIPRMYIVGSKHGSPRPSDVVGFAQKVVQDWTALLMKHGLQPPAI